MAYPAAASAFPDKNETAAFRYLEHDMEFHPAANIFPLMEGADFEALVADIAEHGQREAIVLHDRLILDGRNRYRACERIGLRPVTREWEGDDPAVIRGEPEFTPPALDTRAARRSDTPVAHPGHDAAEDRGRRGGES